jgi:hypothetical protein
VREALCQDLLLDAIVEPIHLSQIESRAQQHLPSASLPERQDEVIAAITSLVGDGLMEPGCPAKDGGFVVEQLEDTLRQIRDTYVARYDDASEWIWSFFLNLTNKGWTAATSTPEGLRIAEYERERLAANREALKPDD